VKAVYTLGLKRRTTGTKDAHGNVIEGHADPVDWPVYAIAPSTSEEPGVDRLAVTTGLSVLAPLSTVPGPLDRVVIDGEEWEIDGEVANYTRGPFGFTPGVVVSLKRAEG
jgi:hypothetical protein